VERANAIALFFSIAAGAGGFYFTHEPLVTLGAAFIGLVAGIPIGKFADQHRKITIIENFTLEPRGVFHYLEEAIEGAIIGEWRMPRRVKEPRPGRPMQLFAKNVLVHKSSSKQGYQKNSTSKISLKAEISSHSGQTTLRMQWTIEADNPHPDQDRVISEVISEVKRLVASHTG
jgi:hypothetical protein